jgi:hypothetical protein
LLGNRKDVICRQNRHRGVRGILRRITKMTRTSLLSIPVNSAEYVVAHAMYQRSRGRKPSMVFKNERNPLKALALAKQELVEPVSERNFETTFGVGSQFWYVGSYCTEPTPPEGPSTVLEYFDFDWRTIGVPDRDISRKVKVRYQSGYVFDRHISDLTHPPHGVFATKEAAWNYYNQSHQQFRSDPNWQSQANGERLEFQRAMDDLDNEFFDDDDFESDLEDEEDIDYRY